MPWDTPLCWHLGWLLWQVGLQRSDLGRHRETKGHYASFFKKKREALGRTQENVARIIRPGFEPSLLRDFEEFDDDDLDGQVIGTLLAKTVLNLAQS